MAGIMIHSLWLRYIEKIKEHMPTLHWVGKEKVVNHHHHVPFRVLNKVSTFRAPKGLPTNSIDNRIIHGDNLDVAARVSNRPCSHSRPI